MCTQSLWPKSLLKTWTIDGVLKTWLLDPSFLAVELFVLYIQAWLSGQFFCVIVGV